MAGERAHAGRRAVVHSECKPGRPWLWERSGLLETPEGVASFSATGGCGLTFHDVALRPQSRWKSTASRPGSCVAASRTALAVGIACETAGSLPRGRDNRPRRHDDA